MSITLPDLAPRTSFTVGGTPTSAFVIPWAYFDDDEIKVLDDGIQVLAFTVTPTTGATATGFVGATVTLDTAVTNSEIVIHRDPPFDRTTSFLQTGPFDMTQLERELDRNVSLSQVLDMWASRTLQIPIETGASGAYDAGGRQILNGPAASEFATRAYVDGVSASAGGSITTETFTAGAAQTQFTLSAPYTNGAGLLYVYIDGSLLDPDSVTEDSTTQFSVTPAMSGGEEVVAFVWNPVPTGSSAASDVTYQGTNVDAFLDQQFDRTSKETTAGVTPTKYGFPPGDVRRYGAVIDGATDDAAALQDALDSGHPVFIPQGTMKVNTVVTRSANTGIFGMGQGITVIDGTGIGTTTGGVIHINATPTQIEELTVSPSQFDTDLTFASAPTLAINDVGLIYNPTDYSYSGFRTVYREGEFFQVQAVSGSVASLTGRLYSGYTAANVDVYTLPGVQVTMKDLTVLAPLSALTAIELDSCSHSSLTNVEGRGSTNAAIQLQRCFDVGLSNCRGVYLDSTGIGNDYGLSVANSQKIRVNGGSYVSRRHAVAVGGGDYAGAVVNREVIISDANLTNFTDQGAADFHGNVEHSMYTGCTINGGSASFGGNNNTFRSNHCFGDTQTSAFAVGEASGIDHTIEGNRFENFDGGSSTRGWGIDLSGNSLALSVSTPKGGVFKIYNNVFINRITTAPTSNQFARIKNQGYVGSESISFEFVGNSIRAGQAQGNTLEVDTVSGNEWDNIFIADNMMLQGNIQITSGQDVFVASNRMKDPTSVAGGDGIFISLPSTNPVIVVRDNYVAGATDDGIVVSGASSSGEEVVVQGNIVNGAGDKGISVASLATVHLLANSVLASTGTAIDANVITTLRSIGNNVGVTKTSVTNDTEVGVDTTNVVMPGLPTSTPGGSGRLWSDSGTVKIT